MANKLLSILLPIQCNMDISVASTATAREDILLPPTLKYKCVNSLVWKPTADYLQDLGIDDRKPLKRTNITEQNPF
jgi:hypothetical protein